MSRKTRSLLLSSLAFFVLAMFGFIVYRLSQYSYTPNRFPEPERTNQIMIRAVADNDMQTTQHLLSQGANPNTLFRYLDEPSETQGYSFHALWIKITGGSGAPVIRTGPTALMKAVATGNPEMVKLLLHYGADV